MAVLPPMLTPCPAPQFAENMVATLHTLDKEAGSGAWFGANDRSEARLSMRNFLTSFVENAFMPTVFLDFKYSTAPHSPPPPLS